MKAETRGQLFPRTASPNSWGPWLTTAPPGHPSCQPAFPGARSSVRETTANPSTFPGRRRLTRKEFIPPTSHNLKAQMRASAHPRSATISVDVITALACPRVCALLELGWRPLPRSFLLTWDSQPILMKLLPDLPHHPSYTGNSFQAKDPMRGVPLNTQVSATICGLNARFQ